MDEDQAGTVALLSIRPEYVRAIELGQKKVEFRRRGFARQVDFVVVYATAPVARIVGYFSVAELVKASPAKLWRRFSKVAGIERSAFYDYYRGAADPIAIKISGFTKLASPVPLTALKRRAPQSYCYLTRGEFLAVATCCA